MINTRTKKLENSGLEMLRARNNNEINKRIKDN